MPVGNPFFYKGEFCEPGTPFEQKVRNSIASMPPRWTRWVRVSVAAGADCVVQAKKLDLDDEEHAGISMGALKQLACAALGLAAGNGVGGYTLKVRDETDAEDAWLRPTSEAESVAERFGYHFASGASFVLELHLVPNAEVPAPLIRTTVTGHSRQDTFVVYRVCVRFNQVSWTILRRYSEFRALHHRMRQEGGAERSGEGWAQRVKPPSREFLTRHSKGAETVARRERLLEAYLCALCALPEIRRDPPPALLAFLGALDAPRAAHARVVLRHRGKVHVSLLEQFVSEGDVVLFRSKNNPGALLQRRVTKSEWDHVAIVVQRKNRRSKEVLEATGDGVHCYPLAARVEAYYDGFASAVAVRRLTLERSEAMLRGLRKFVSHVCGKPYELSLGKLLFATNGVSYSASAAHDIALAKPELSKARARIDSAAMIADSTQEGFFCSELVAQALMVMGVLPKAHAKASFFWPASFQCGAGVDRAAQKHLRRDVVFEDIFIVDASISELGVSFPPSSPNPAPQRFPRAVAAER